jgi:hypothetical protein
MKMEFDSEQIARYLKLLKSYDLEISALRAVYEVILQSGRFPDLTLALQAARTAVQSEMDAKYDPAMETLLNAPDQKSLDQALAGFLAKWTPKGRPN